MAQEPETQRKPLTTRAIASRLRIPFQTRIVLLALAGGLPAILLVLIMLRNLDILDSVHRLIVVVLLAVWIGFAIAIYRATVEPLRSIANLLEALRGGDYAVRGRYARKGDALGDVIIESNRLGATLRSQRFEALEASALLHKVLAEIDVVVLAFDGDGVIRLANRAAGELLRRRPETLTGLTATEAGIEGLVDGPAVASETFAFPARSGRWQVMRETFREGGRLFRLLVVTDLSQALRDEERRAWRRLIRVIWHELNNSLAPIKSVIETSRDALASGPLEPGDRKELSESLAVMAERAEGLRRFLSRYSELARLPEPTLADCNAPALLRQVAAVQAGSVRVTVPDGLHVRGDADQLQQALINLVRNAIEATADGKEPVELRAARGKDGIVFEVEDSGRGVANPDNLFVPFFTTKPGGSGIGLVLARQVAEAHGGSLSLQNRSDRSGCIARMFIPG